MKNHTSHEAVKNPVRSILIIFLVCCAVHYFEVLVLRTDETVLADNFMNKVIGIAILAICLGVFHLSWREIGFRSEKLTYLGYGFGVGLLCFFADYGAEFLLLSAQNQSPGFEWYVSGFSITGELIKQTGLLAYFLCILFNVVNVVMEEGIFRGLFIKLGMQRLGFVKANWLAALLFGFWHLSLPVRGLLDGEMSAVEAVLLGIGYVILAALMGVKWGLWLRNTGCLWFGIAEHFFNNTIGNLLHVVSITGHDELQIIRILIAQMLSLILTLVVNHRTKKRVGR